MRFEAVHIHTRGKRTCIQHDKRNGGGSRSKRLKKRLRLRNMLRKCRERAGCFIFKTWMSFQENAEEFAS